jgi:Cu(I)/Ag(I) efflux system membrane fusion protein
LWPILVLTIFLSPAGKALAQHDHGQAAGAGAADREPSWREITLSPEAVKLARIQVSAVVRKEVQAEIRMVGKVDYDETRLSYITAWVPGRIDRLYINFTGTRVNKGDRMVYLYSPELYTAQQELLQAIKSADQLKKSGLKGIRSTARATISASRSRLRLWGLTKAQIDDIIKQDRPSENITILAPISGVVVEKKALEGQYVRTGTRIYTIADLSRVWVKLDAYESNLIWLKEGQEVGFWTEAYPGQVFRGSVAFIDPFLDPKTRTVKVRLNVPNRDGELKPEMFVRAVLKVPVGSEEQGGPPLVIPASAPLITGTRAVVYLAVPGRPGTYEGREIVLGPRVGNHYIVRHGLTEGEMVVTKGNFKIDSAVQIMAKPSMMSPEGGGSSAGHQHGGEQKTQPARADQPMAMETPSSFREELRPVMEIHRMVAYALELGDLERIRREFGRLEPALAKIDPSPLSDHPRMVWQELKMLLSNDSAEGSAVDSVKAAGRVFKSLTDHIARIRKTFQIGHQDHG